MDSDIKEEIKIEKIEICVLLAPLSWKNTESNFKQCNVQHGKQYFKKYAHRIQFYSEVCMYRYTDVDV